MSWYIGNTIESKIHIFSLFILCQYVNSLVLRMTHCLQMWISRSIFGCGGKSVVTLHHSNSDIFRLGVPLTPCVIFTWRNWILKVRFSGVGVNQFSEISSRKKTICVSSRLIIQIWTFCRLCVLLYFLFNIYSFLGVITKTCHIDAILLVNRIFGHWLLDMCHFIPC